MKPAKNNATNRNTYAPINPTRSAVFFCLSGSCDASAAIASMLSTDSSPSMMIREMTMGAASWKFGKAAAIMVRRGGRCAEKSRLARKPSRFTPCRASGPLKMAGASHSVRSPPDPAITAARAPWRGERAIFRDCRIDRMRSGFREVFRNHHEQLHQSLCCRNDFRVAGGGARRVHPQDVLAPRGGHHALRRPRRTVHPHGAGHHGAGGAGDEQILV